MKIKSLMSLLLTMSALLVSAQDEKNDVMQVIQNVFIAMETNDSTLAKSAFTEDATLTTVTRNDAGEVIRRTNPAQRLISAFGQPKEETWSEPIWNEKVNIDGDFASVWVDYAFYRGNTFSHCGIDAFFLIRTNDGWKIFSLADTRRTEGCEVPKEIRAQY